MLNYFFKSSLNIYYETPTCLFLKIQETQTYVTKQVKDLIPQSHCSEIIIFNKRCLPHIYICYCFKYHVEKYLFKKSLHKSGKEKNWEETNYMSDFDIYSFFKDNISYIHYTFRNDKMIIIISAKSYKITCLEITDIPG